jgi:predicted nucleotidyltransferase
MEFASTCELVAETFDGNTTKTALWFMTPNPQLHHSSPRDLLRRGHREMLQRQVLDALAGQGAVPEVPIAASPGRALLDSHRAHLQQLCERYAVRHLAVFGSALRADFDLTRSDIDLAVEFDSSAPISPARQYFDFKAALEQLLGRGVDLVELTAMPDSRLRRIITRTQVPLYDQAA